MSCFTCEVLQAADPPMIRRDLAAKDVMSKEITATEYAALVGVTGAAITKRIRKGWLPFVNDISKYGNSYKLKLSRNFTPEKASIFFKRSSLN